MHLKRLIVGVLALLLSLGALAPATAAPPPNISQTVGVCDPNWPQRCVQGGPFVPDAVSLATLAVTSSSGRVALGGAGPTVLLWNNGATDVSLKLGGSTITAATTDFILGAGRAITFARRTDTFVAAITASSTSTLVVETGAGVPALMAPGGSGGGGGGGAVTIADGADVTLGAKADSVCSTDTGTCTAIALFKRNNAQTTAMITALGSPFQAGGSIGNTTFAATSTITSPTSTPTISTSAYTTGMVLGGIQSFTSQPNTGVIANAHVQFASGTFSGSVDLELFNASPTGGGTTDHAAYALTATDTAKKIGELHLNDCTSDGGVLVSCQNLYQSQFYTLAAAGTTVFIVAVVRGTPTFAGTTDAIFGLQVVK